MNKSALVRAALGLTSRPAHLQSWRVGKSALARAALGLTLALGVAEATFRARDGGAFPLVNIYETDAELGVRLRATAHTSVRSSGGAAIEVRTNAAGFRGPAWPAPSPTEMVVVGDSQSFGLGVEEGERLSAELSRQLGVTVLDASTPTYGPFEYETVASHLATSRHPKTIVVALNLLNDLSELSAPNLERYAAFDGFAVRRDPSRPLVSSPFREAAIRESHLAFALWRAWQTSDPRADVPMHDERAELLAIAHDAADVRRRDDALDADVARYDTELALARDRRAKASANLVAVAKASSMLASYGEIRKEWSAYVDANGEPEAQTFELRYGGCGWVGRGPREYRARFAGDRIKEDVERVMQDFSRIHGSEVATNLARALVEREDANVAFRKLSATPRPDQATSAPPLPTDDFVVRMVALAKANDARVALVVLPVDAVVDERIAAARGISGDALFELDILADTLAKSARARGAIGIDPTSALRDLGADAYQPDGHLTAAGHRAVAQVVAEALRE